MKKLSKEQMKMVVGGVNQNPKCSITYCPGFPSNGGPNYMCTNTTPNECQAAADTWCSNNNACCDVDCPGAD